MFIRAMIMAVAISGTAYVVHPGTSQAAGDPPAQVEQAAHEEETGGTRSNSRMMKKLYAKQTDVYNLIEDREDEKSHRPHIFRK